MVELSFYADFTCPFSYVAQGALLPSVADQLELHIKWQPYELDPSIPAEGRTLGGAEAGRIWGSTRRLLERHCLLVSRHAPALTPNTSLALAAAEYSRDHGDLPTFVAAVFSAYFEHHNDISKAGLITELAPGFDPADPRWSDCVSKRRAAATALGVSAVPAFALDHRVLHGIRDDEDLLEFLRG